MRENITADWAFGIKGAIENIVRSDFPNELRLWPLLQTFDFEAYEMPADHMVIILRDKLSGIPTGPGKLKPFPFSDHPTLPAKASDADRWQQYLRNKFDLGEEDAAIIVPIHDSGQNDASKDFALFSDSEKALWHRQITMTVARQKTKLSPPAASNPEQPFQITYNISGTNSRVNINSQDSSVNIQTVDATKVFADLREACLTIEDKNVRQKVSSAIDDMESSYGTDTFLARYQKFMSAAAVHMTVFAPFLPALSGLLV